MSADAPSSYSASTRWTNEIAIDPSPTADATRLMLPHRTSPTANTQEVSSRYGDRSSGATDAEDTRVLGGFLHDVIVANDDRRNFRIFGPDETVSNRLDPVFAATNRQWDADTQASDESLAPDGRVLEMPTRISSWPPRGTCGRSKASQPWRSSGTTCRRSRSGSSTSSIS
jgi:hypothetical protein